MQRTRLIPDRFRRIWAMVEAIAQEPGLARRQLAERFSLSERQVQADLNIIRSEMRLPLLRRRGYRFVPDPPAGGTSFTLTEVHLLLLVLRKAAKDKSIPQERLLALMERLPSAFPPHLQPLVSKTLESIKVGQQLGRQEVFAALAEALLKGADVKLHYPHGDGTSSLLEPIVKPHLLVPFLSSWFLIGECRQRRRVMMFNLDSVVAVTVGPT